MRVRAWHGAVVVLGVVVGLIVVAYVRGPGDPAVAATATAATPVPSPSASSLGMVQIAGLVPAEPAASEWEDTEAVQAIRQYETVSAWASLTGTWKFQQWQDLIDPSGAGVSSGLVSPSYVAWVGPTPFTPVDVALQDDGTTVVEACYLYSGQLKVVWGKEEPSSTRREYKLMRYVLSPLTEQERELLGDRAEDYSSLRVRDTEYLRDKDEATAACSDVPIVVQQFENWKQYLGSAGDE